MAQPAPWSVDSQPCRSSGRPRGQSDELASQALLQGVDLAAPV